MTGYGSTSPDSALTFTLSLSKTTWESGSRATGTATVTNTGVDRVTFYGYWYNEEAIVMTDPPDTVSAIYHDVPYLNEQVFTLDHYESATFPVDVPLTRCGDTSRDGEVPLPSGSYVIVAFMEWMSTPNDYGRFPWKGEPVSIVITE
ncbi:MAG: hypothetical protein QOG53_1772 [Frankiales bacterium]|jgi:hypothetical protein|nr:hypothetical protein [Frankiales bacterium]